MFYQLFVPQGGAYRKDFLDEKSEAPAIPLGVDRGGRGFNTNDWWISILDVTLGMRCRASTFFPLHTVCKPILKIVTNALFDSISWNK